MSRTFRAKFAATGFAHSFPAQQLYCAQEVMDFKQWKLLCAAGIFILLTAAKLLLPDGTAALRLKLMNALAYDEEYIEALESLSDRLTLRESTAEQTEPTTAPLLIPVAAKPCTEVYYLCYAVDEAAAAGEREPETPAVVAAFLESQAAFADYALPDTVDYTYTALPFDYAIPVSGRNSSGFGYRMHPILNTIRFHYGTDFAANAGEAVLAFADGTVTYAGYDESFGWHIKIDHGSGWESHYAHCSCLYAEAGQRVSADDCIALVGATGLATGPHLHFELTKDGNYVNPEYYINQ